MKNPKVIVGMSGGVDSSVSAWLLQQQGYTLAGMFMKNWEEDDTDTYCSATQDIADAQAVCDQLGIELHKINFATEYWDNIFTHFLNEYRAGRTPNPDVLCNQLIKFDAFLKFALDLGADYIAMGHYAQLHTHDKQFQLMKGHDPLKDQSYFLHRLNQYQLSKSLFPVGHLNKTAVRQIATEQQLPNHNKKDSTGICFIGERKFKTFLQTYLPAQAGEMLTIEGNVIGRHDGLMYYTIGQRQGLGIGGQSNKPEQPWYVVDKNLEKNQLIVAQGEHPALYKQTLIAGDIHWIASTPPAIPLQCAAKIRYRQADQACTMTALDEQHYQVTFAEPQRAITPGQSIVFYQGEHCLGGAIIQ